MKNVMFFFFFLGILLWEIWSGGMLPYPDLELQTEVSEQVMFHSAEVLLPGFDCYTMILQVLTGYRLFKPKTCSQEVYNLMQQCWQMVSSE